MHKTIDICEEISKSPELMLRFNQTQSFDELYDLCKEIDSNITETEIEEKIKKLVSRTASSSKVELSDSDLEMVAGGVMDFNKWKASALTALAVLGAVTATSAVSQTYAYSASPQSVTTSTNKSLSIKEQQLLNSDLHTAVKKGDKSNCEELLNLGANIDARGESGQSPLEYSVFLGNVDMVKFFLEKGADINFKNNDKETPLMYCVPSTSYSELAVSGNAEIIAKLLLENGAKVNEKTYKGDTALEKAVLKGYTELAKLFHKYGATADGKNDKGQTKMFENLNPRKDLPRDVGFIPKAMMENNQKITKL